MIFNEKNNLFFRYQRFINWKTNGFLYHSFWNEGADTFQEFFTVWSWILAFGFKLELEASGRKFGKLANYPSWQVLDPIGETRVVPNSFEVLRQSIPLNELPMLH